MNLIIVALIYFLKIFPGFEMKTAFTVKLESVIATYVNTTLIDYEVNLVPYNNTINVFNQTMTFKFDVSSENILLADSTAYKITKTNRAIQISHVIFPYKETITMERIDIGTMWRDYTKPPLFWPPQVNVTYRTFGWAPDVSKYPSAVPSGGIKILTIVRFRNHTKVFGNQWIINVIYL